MLATRPTTFTLDPLGPFSLAAAARFWSGFTPANHGGLDAEGHLHMAFPVEGTWDTVGVCLQEVDHSLVGQVYGDHPDVQAEAVERQTSRILSLDVDGRAFADVGAHDPVVERLQQHFPGLRPVCFYSPYEAAAWAILSHRIQMRQASTIRSRLRDAFGQQVSIHGQPMAAFPPPEALLDLQSFPGLSARKPEYLRSIARAALDGDLDAAPLRALPDDLALARLQALPGIGPFSAELILLRGAGHPDYLTLLEPRFRRAVASAYGLKGTPEDADLQRISEAWRPFRMWVTFLLRQAAPEVMAPA